MSVDYGFDGLDELERQAYQVIERDFPAEFEKLVIQIAYELQTKTKEKTPVRTGVLQDGWQVGDVKKVDGEYVIEVFNNTEYAAEVEYGHRKRGGQGMVPGRHMMELSMQEVQARLDPFLRQWLHDFLDRQEL